VSTHEIDNILIIIIATTTKARAPQHDVCTLGVRSRPVRQAVYAKPKRVINQNEWRFSVHL
jgi:hypothetical protein